MNKNKTEEIDIRKNKAVRAYVKHGFEPVDWSGEQIFGDCAFCGGDSKMYVNADQSNGHFKNWRCFSCGREGGFQKFLQETVSVCKEQFKQIPAIKLRKSRQISLKVLREFDIGYNQFTKRYTIPVYNFDKSKLIDIRTFSPTVKGVYSTPDCKVGLYNAGDIKDKNTIWLCEGEWDCLAWKEVLSSLKINDAVVAVPGGRTLKIEWDKQFIDKNVIVLYDNDETGFEGSKKVFKRLKSSTKSLKFIRWENDRTKRNDKFDIRDLCIEVKDHEKIYQHVNSLLSEKPPHVKESDLSPSEKDNEKEPTECILPQELYTSYKKWLYVPDTDIIDAIYGTIIANRLDGDPLWLFVVAPPGMTKTEFIMSTAGANKMHSVSKVTAAGLISGSYGPGGEDPSLLSKLDGKTLLVKDFTTILGMAPEARSEIFGILRDAYDGECIRHTGLGERKIKARFGMIAGVTEALEQILEGESALGARFVSFCIPLPPTLKEQMIYLDKATCNVNQELGMRKELSEKANQCLNFKFNTDVKISDNLRLKLLYAALFVAKLRGSITRDKFSKEITYEAQQELGTRLGKQFVKLCMGIAMFHQRSEVSEHDIDIALRIARGTVPKRVEKIFHSVFKKFGSKEFTEREAGELSILPFQTTQRILETLYMLGALTRKAKGKGRLARLAGFTYSISIEMREAVKKSGIYRRSVKKRL